MRPDKGKDTFERKTFRTSRLAEFASIPELIKQTGQPVANWPLVIVKELVDNAPPLEIIDLVRDARDVLVAHLQQKRAIRAWINDNLSPGEPGVCMHCGGQWLADESIIMVWCGADYGDVHEVCWEAWEAEQDRRARKALGFV